MDEMQQLQERLAKMLPSQVKAYALILMIEGLAECVRAAAGTTTWHTRALIVVHRLKMLAEYGE